MKVEVLGIILDTIISYKNSVPKIYCPCAY